MLSLIRPPVGYSVKYDGLHLFVTFFNIFCTSNKSIFHYKVQITRHVIAFNFLSRFNLTNKTWFGLLPYFSLFLLMLLWRHSFKLPQIKCVILRLRVSQFLGKISMALYLIHWPVALYFQHYLGHFIGATETMLYICGVSFVLSVIATYLVEDPLRNVLKASK